MKIDLTISDLEILWALIERDNMRNYALLDDEPANGYTAIIDQRITRIKELHAKINRQL